MSDDVIDPEDLPARVTPDKLGLVCGIRPRRLGCNLFCVLLEHRHFSPRDPVLNALFEICIVPGPDDIVFYLVLVPMTYRPIVESVALECRLRLADGVPHILGGSKTWVFPVNQPNVFTLENLDNSFVYMNNQKLFEAASEVERQKIDEVFRQFERGL